MPPRESHHSVKPWSPQPSTRNQPTPKLDTCWNNNSQGDTQGFFPPPTRTAWAQERTVYSKKGGERIQAYCDEQKTHREKHNKTSHTPCDTHPTTPTPATPGKKPNISAPLTHNPAQNPLNHTQTTNHDQRRWGMLNFLSPNTQAEPSTLQHAKQPGTLY